MPAPIEQKKDEQPAAPPPAAPEPTIIYSQEIDPVVLAAAVKAELRRQTGQKQMDDDPATNPERARQKAAAQQAYRDRRRHI